MEKKKEKSIRDQKVLIKHEEITDLASGAVGIGNIQITKNLIMQIIF